MNIPKILYHYTSIESLALILKNKTIRLNPLDKMDDLQENMTQDIKNLGRFIFVSSWTAEEKESIPMWKMYSDIKSGVRIALPANPFMREYTKGKINKKPKNAWGYDVEDDDLYTDTFLDINKLNRLGVIPFEVITGDILKKIEYTDDIALLEPKLIQDDSIIFDKLGIYKSTYWEFQEEWRYMLHFLATYTGENDEERAKFYRNLMDRIWAGTATLPILNFDLTIRDDAFSQMEILKSPKLSEGNSILLDSLVKTYNPTAKIYSSKLTGLL